jgi:hypothetical protein
VRVDETRANETPAGTRSTQPPPSVPFAGMLMPSTRPCPAATAVFVPTAAKRSLNAPCAGTTNFDSIEGVCLTCNNNQSNTRTHTRHTHQHRVHEMAFTHPSSSSPDRPLCAPPDRRRTHIPFIAARFREMLSCAVGWIPTLLKADRNDIRPRPDRFCKLANFEKLGSSQRKQNVPLHRETTLRKATKNPGAHASQEPNQVG